MEQSKTTPGRMTVEQAKALIASGHVVFAYPRLRAIRVDGFRRYAASAAVCSAVKRMNAERVS